MCGVPYYNFELKNFKNLNSIHLERCKINSKECNISLAEEG
jgi:hypothetical protein